MFDFLLFVIAVAALIVAVTEVEPADPVWQAGSAAIGAGWSIG